MDAQHRADLDRILANRRAGGRLKNAGPSAAASPGGLTGGSASAGSPPNRGGAVPPRAYEAADVGSRNDGAAARQQPPAFQYQPARQSYASPQQQQPPQQQQSGYLSQQPSGYQPASQPQPQPQPQRTLSPEGPGSPVARDVAMLKEQVNALQRKLDSGDTKQAERMDDIRQDIRLVQETLLSPQHGGHSGPGSSSRRSVPRGKGGSIMMPVPRMVPEPSFAAGAATATGRSLGKSRSMRSSEPRPVEFSSRVSSVRPAAPPEPPLAARPYATSTIDIDTCVSMMHRGEWFLKWNTNGSDVKPQYVWLNTTSYMLQWGKAPDSRSLLSSFIKLEEVFNVTTTQITEHHESAARVFHVIILHTPTRVLRLGTERRDKLDLWYDALTNIITFYRSQQQLSRRFANSSD